MNAFLAKAAKAEQKLQKQIQGLIKEAERRAAAREKRQHQHGLGGGGNGYFSWPTTGVHHPGIRVHRLLLGAAVRQLRPLPQGIDIANGSGHPDPCGGQRGGGVRRA